MSNHEGPAPQFNPRPPLQKLILGNEKRSILVFDDFLVNPSDFVAWAQSEAHFKPPKDTNYPGIVAPLTRAIALGTLSAISDILAFEYKVPHSVPLNCSGNYSLMTTPQDLLNPMQSVPHFDAPTPFRLAMLLYLFHPPQGGTAFYRHRSTGFETVDASRLETFVPAYLANLKNREDRKRCYFGETDEDYIQIAKVDAVFNRLVVYPSFLLHSALIDAALLSCEPHKGRLTVNMFVQAG